MAALVDTAVWLACAVPFSRLPTVGSQVYYFPHGHAEQCPKPLPGPLPKPHLFPCTVTAVRLDADAKTNEVFAEITLQPGPHRGPPASSSSSSAADDNNHDDSICYYAKQLTQSDANNGGGFSVPRHCAESIFPKLDLEADPPVQTLVMRDIAGNEWRFRHIYRGTPRRHLLTTGWSKFVNAKLLVAGDHVVFMRRDDGQLLLGLRREPRYNLHDERNRNNNVRARVPPEDVLEAVRLVTEGSPFTVAFYPRLGAGEFVVPRKEVEDAIGSTWDPGMLVRMQIVEPEDGRRSEWATGTVNGLHANIWRAVEVDWDSSAPTALTKSSRFVNGWQLQFIGFAPLLKRFRMVDPPCSAAPIPAGMQGARQTAFDDAPAPPSSSSATITTQLLFPSPVEDISGAGGSEILDPEFGSPPSNSVNMLPPNNNLPAAAAVETRSIQLFGTTIVTPHAAADGASEEANNEVPDGVVDENVEQDDA